MNRLEKIIAQIQETLAEETNLEERLDDLSTAAASIEREQAPELARITLLHSDIILARAEKSRRFWQKLTIALCIVAAGLVALLIQNEEDTNIDSKRNCLGSW